MIDEYFAPGHVHSFSHTLSDAFVGVIIEWENLLTCVIELRAYALVCLSICYYLCSLALFSRFV